MEWLLRQYGPSLIINLLGDRDMEPLLSESYFEHLSNLSLPGSQDYVQFDYHAHCRPGNTQALESLLMPQCKKSLEQFQFFVSLGGDVISAQQGVFRVNCLDCLDRSNNTQTLFGLEVRNGSTISCTQAATDQ